MSRRVVEHASMIYRTKLKKKEEVAEGTTAFYFEKPAGFMYKPGQHIDIKLLNPRETDAEGNSRIFSLVSAPYEEDITVTTRMRPTAFKRVFGAMPLGTEVEFEGPFGSMVLHNDSMKPAVFLAGGIGITPFMSMVREAIYEKLPHKIYLFYSNRRPEDTAFLKKLQETQKRNPNFVLIATMTDAEKSAKPWNGERGYIDGAMLKKFVSDLTKPIYYLAGPPLMVQAMREMIVKAGADEDNIKSEEFAGY